MVWRLADSLITFRSQINAAYPNRNKASDGTIGDTAHQAVQSEHNPNSAGVVTAIDITHDPDNGLDIQALADDLVQSGDERIWYIIANERIWEGSWSAYSGTSDPHINHLHLSVDQNPALYDNSSLWGILENDMKITEDVFRRLWSLVGLDIGPEGRQPEAREVKEAVGRDFDEFVDYWGNTTPLKKQREKAALYNAVTSDLLKQLTNLSNQNSAAATAKIDKIKAILAS